MRPPLTKADLIAIRDRNPDPDVRTLLWEIKRLRALVLRSHDLVRLLDDRGGPAGILIHGLREVLKDEPVVLEQVKLE
jgi:hypothetical protein